MSAWIKKIQNIQASKRLDSHFKVGNSLEKAYNFSLKELDLFAKSHIWVCSFPLGYLRHASAVISAETAHIATTPFCSTDLKLQFLDQKSYLGGGDLVPLLHTCTVIYLIYSLPFSTVIDHLLLWLMPPLHQFPHQVFISIRDEKRVQLDCVLIYMSSRKHGHSFIPYIIVLALIFTVLRVTTH